MNLGTRDSKERERRNREKKKEREEVRERRRKREGLNRMSIGRVRARERN